ncbi:MAG: AAA family ATPase [Salinivirgaceae bacterium]|nr:AAA family ATPase [Salinivirgaceae bacterium]
MKTKKTTKQEMTLLAAVEQIVELSHDSKLELEFFRKAAKPIKYLADKLELTREQVVMMAMFIDNSDDREISLRDLAKQSGCSTTRILKYVKDIKELVSRDMVRERGCGNYRVPWYVIEAFTRNEKFEGYKNANISCDEFFGVLDDIFSIREEHEMTSELTIKRLQSLMDENKQLAFVQQVRSYGLDEEDEALLLLFAHLFVDNNDNHVGYDDIDYLFRDTRHSWNRVKSRLNSGSHELIEKKIIEYNNNDGLADSTSFRITDEAKRLLFSEMENVLVRPDASRQNLVRCETIAPKKLYFDKVVEEQIADLGRLLDEKHYADICNRMKDKGYRCGFTCLFYGAPGTGKTESVLQLARQTGRDIMQVNISQIKSKWVGDSEKNIKNVFDTYRTLVDKQKVTPILLFNEADAIIGKRMENTERAVDKMENSIQNIILQEMETLKGILIATTNLAQNLDKAFERRFLYKVKFSKPTTEAREHIWHTMLPELSADDISVLAEKYNFSGGQIENIARHYTIDTILHSDQAAALATLIRHCDSERLEKSEKRAIGFGN